MQGKRRCTKRTLPPGAASGRQVRFESNRAIRETAKTKVIPLNVSRAVIHHNGLQHRYVLTVAFHISRLCSSSAPPA